MRTNLMQKEASSVLGVSTSSVEKWETGNREPKQLTKESVFRRMQRYIEENPNV